MRAIKKSIAEARDERAERERAERERADRERAERERADRERELHDVPGQPREHTIVLTERDIIAERAIDDATCEHVTRELTTRIDTNRYARVDASISRTSHQARREDTSMSLPSNRARRADTSMSLSSNSKSRSEAAPDGAISPIYDLSRRRLDVAPLRCEPCPRVLPSRRLFDGSVLQHFQCDGTCARDQQRARDRARRHDAIHEELHDKARDVPRRAIGERRATSEREASKRELRSQIAITCVLALLAATWIVLAAREASADTRTRDATDTRTRGATDTRAQDAPGKRRTTVASDAPHDDGDGDDDDAIDVAAPAIDEPFTAPVVAPPVAEVLAAAYRTAGLDHDLGRFAARSRWAGLVPWLSVRTGRDTSWRDDEPNISRGVTLEVRATWRLDRLVFDGRELQVSSLEAARRRERRRLAARVIQVYFAWKRAARSAGIRRGSASAAEEAAAELDDLTDGWFTEAREGQRR